MKGETTVSSREAWGTLASCLPRTEGMERSPCNNGTSYQILFNICCCLDESVDLAVLAVRLEAAELLGDKTATTGGATLLVTAMVAILVVHFEVKEIGTVREFNQNCLWEK